MRIANLVTKVRALSPGGSSVTYWASLAVLIVLAGLPFALLSWAAPSSEEEAALTPARVRTSARVADAVPTPRAAASSPPAGPESSPPDTPGNALVPPSPALSDAPPPDEAMGADFDIRCWPTVSVVPGGSATVDCSIPVFHGDGSDISLECRAEGMSCAMSPRKVRALDNQTLTARLTVTAPGSAPVGIVRATARASGGETGAAVEETGVDVDVPPPFSVSCESIGAAFAKGSDARIQCWITFAAGFSDDVALSIKDAGVVHAALDTPAMRPAPNQTRAFTIQLDTEQLEISSYAVAISAVSARYEQEASALFQVLPR